jgi:hypothetical protein
MNIHAVARLARWLTRDHAVPAQPCVACAAQSARHPAGLLQRHTSVRLAGLPICERHSLTEIDELLP